MSRIKSIRKNQMNNDLDVSRILDKLKQSIGVKTDKDLSDILQVRPNTISTWRMRNSMHYERLIQASLINNINLNELFFNREQELTDSIIVVPKEFQFQYVSQRNNRAFIADLPVCNLP